MKSKSSTLLPLLILLLVPLLAGSIYYAQDSYRKVVAANTAKANADKKFKEADKYITDIRMQLEPYKAEKESTLGATSDSYVVTQLSIMRAAQDNDIALQSLGPNQAGVSNVLTVGKPFSKAPSVKSFALRVNGKFRSYEQFKAFMAGWREQPVTVQSMKVTEDQFTVVLQGYGT